MQDDKEVTKSSDVASPLNQIQIEAGSAVESLADVRQEKVEELSNVIDENWSSLLTDNGSLMGTVSDPWPAVSLCSDTDRAGECRSGEARLASLSDTSQRNHLRSIIDFDSTHETSDKDYLSAREQTIMTKAAEGEGSTSEILDIMDHFGDDKDESKRRTPTPDLASGVSGLEVSVRYPPRRSSLEPMISTSPRSATGSIGGGGHMSYQLGSTSSAQERDVTGVSNQGHPARISSLPHLSRFRVSDASITTSPNSLMPLPKMSPPEPDSELDLPFDFHRFLEQLRHRTADPVAKFLRSFLNEFGKKQWMVHEQVKIINDFSNFITHKMAQCEVWREVSDAEFDNAKEGMEKLIMNRLYSQTFSPAIPSVSLMSGPKKKKRALDKPLGPGRIGQHQEDIERDEVLSQKVQIYGWVREEHLDIQVIGESGRRFLLLAQQELLKITTYRAPRDKIICVLNCCKVIFGLLRNSKSADMSADSFVPLLIYIVLHANPDHLVSNVQYILRFRNQDKLGGEAGYYLSSLMGAIQFIENLDRMSLTVSDEDFEKNVEAAVSKIAERHKEDISSSPPLQQLRYLHLPQISEKSGLSQPEVVPEISVEAQYSAPRRSLSFRDNAGSFVGSEGSEDNTAVTGLLRTIQRPLSSLGRIFSDGTPNLPERLTSQSSSQTKTSQPLPLAAFQPSSNLGENNDLYHGLDGKFTAEDAAAHQAVTETGEAQRMQRAEHHNLVETLAVMFPDLDKDLIDDVIRMKQGKVGLAVDACLALNS